MKTHSSRNIAHEPNPLNKAIFAPCYLFLWTVFVFGRLNQYGFINYDDPKYVTENRQVKAGLTWEGIHWAFTTFHASNWHPLTWLSHMLDCTIFGLSPDGHHLTSVVLHAFNTCLLFLILQRMTGSLWRSFFVASLFGLHPLHVESVAWVAERKDVLSAFFGLLALWAYASYAQRPDPKRYLMVVAAFVLGLMAKPMLVTLPFLLLLLDFWPLRRFGVARQASSPPSLAVSAENSGEKAVAEQPRPGANPSCPTASLFRLVFEKLPLFALSAASSVVTWVAQSRGGALSDLESLSISYRLSNAVIAYVAYIQKMFWPSGLAVFYPLPEEPWPLWKVIAALLLLLLVSAWAVRAAPRFPYFAVGWLWYLGTLLPVIGLVQVGLQSMADRYTYLPLTGLFLMVVWGLSDFAARWYYGNLTLGIAGGAILMVFSLCSNAQLQHWRNSITLFEHALKVEPHNDTAHLNLGAALAEKGQIEEAMDHYGNALEINSRNGEAHNNLGVLLARQGKQQEATSYFLEALRLQPASAEAHNNLANAFLAEGQLENASTHFSEALRIRPDYAEAHYNLAICLAHQGRVDDGVAHFFEALRFRPDHAEAHNNLATLLARQGKVAEAIAHLLQAIRIRPDYAGARFNLGSILVRQGRLEEAILHFSAILRTHPDYAEARYQLGLAFARTGRTEEALAEYREALLLKPGWLVVMGNLAWILATHEEARFRDAAEAVRLAEECVAVSGGKDARILDTLAAAYAEAGRLEEALKTAQKAADLFSAPGQEKLAGPIRKRIELYRSGLPYRETPLSAGVDSSLDP